MTNLKKRFHFKRAYEGAYVCETENDLVYVERSVDFPGAWVASNVEGVFGRCEEAKAAAREVMAESE